MLIGTFVEFTLFEVNWSENILESVKSFGVRKTEINIDLGRSYEYFKNLVIPY